MIDRYGGNQIRLDRFTTDQLLQLWANTARRFQRSRQRITYCQSVQLGGEGVVRPDLKPNPTTGERRDPKEDPLTMMLPGRINIPLQMVNEFVDDAPRIERRPIGTSPTATSDAESLGTWLNEAISQTVDIPELYGKKVEDAEHAIIVQPDTAHFRRSPSFMDTIPGYEWGLLDESEQQTYQPSQDRAGEYVRVNSKGQPQINPMWYRDQNGHPPDSPNYNGRRHPGQTKKAWQEARQAYLSSIPPWVVRIVSALDCVPILINGRGPERFECIGLVVRTLYSEEELLMSDYLWEKGANTIIPEGYDPDNYYGAYGRVWLYEAHLTIQGHPIVAYSVGGQPTYRAPDNNVSYVVDLFEEYGIQRLFVRYSYGLHNSHDNPDNRGIPLLWPQAKMLVGAESLMTATNVHTWKTAFSGWFLPITPDAPRESYLEANGDWKKFSMPESGEVVPVPGVPIPAAPAEISETARYTIQLLLAQVAAADPDKDEGNQSSGHGLSVANDLKRAAQRQIPMSVGADIQFIGESVLEIADTIKKRFKVPVSLWINEQIEPGADRPGESRSQYRVLELQDRWIGGVYALDAVFPERGNLAEVSMLSDLQKKGQATMRDLLKARGKENPSLEQAMIDAEQILTGTPEGKMAALANALRLRGEQQQADALDLQVQQRLSQFGMPTAAMQGAPGQGLPQAAPGQVPTGPHQPGTQIPNIADSVRGGVVAGEVGQHALLNDARAQVRAGEPMGVQPGVNASPQGQMI